jgi:hypothetical protein
MGQSDMPPNPQPEIDRLYAAADQVIAACGGDIRAALKAMIAANEQLQASVSNGFTRGVRRRATARIGTTRRRAMTDIASDLKERFDWAMYHCLEAYTVLPDGKSIVRSDEDEQAIGVFKNLYDSVDAIPPTLIKTAEKLRTAVPEKFELTLVHGVQVVRCGYFPTSATEFVEFLNRTVQRDMVRIERVPVKY